MLYNGMHFIKITKSGILSVSSEKKFKKQSSRILITNKWGENLLKKSNWLSLRIAYFCKIKV